MDFPVTNSRDRLVLPTTGNTPVLWRISPDPVGYEEAVAEMESRVEAIARGEAPELVWLLEHPPLYTAGTGARDQGMPSSLRGFPVYPASRGGQVTYHGPGQRVAYVMLDLTARGRDVRCFVAALEAWLLRTLAAFNISGERRENRVGVWVPRPEKGLGREDKIAAIGVRVRRWATFHGVSLNVDPDLSHFDAIVPCGITDQGVTSFEDLGRIVLMSEIDTQLRVAFEAIFGPTVDEDARDASKELARETS